MPVGDGGRGVGTPTVALAVGGLPESIDDGRTGLLAQDGEDLGRKIGQVLADTELRDRLGNAAYERAHEFTWDATARSTLDLLQRERARALATAGGASVNGAPPDRWRAASTTTSRTRSRSLAGVEGWLSDGQAERLFVAGRSVTAGGRIVEIGSLPRPVDDRPRAAPPATVSRSSRSTRTPATTAARRRSRATAPRPRRTTAPSTRT